MRREEQFAIRGTREKERERERERAQDREPAEINQPSLPRKGRAKSKPKKKSVQENIVFFRFPKTRKYHTYKHTSRRDKILVLHTRMMQKQTIGGRTREREIGRKSKKNSAPHKTKQNKKRTNKQPGRYFAGME